MGMSGCTSMILWVILSNSLLDSVPTPALRSGVVYEISFL